MGEPHLLSSVFQCLPLASFNRNLESFCHLCGVPHLVNRLFSFQADFKLMCDNAMTYNRPDTVYYKLAKKILHAGFKMMSKVRGLRRRVRGCG